MAIINCPECGAPVSDNATACPQCGSPISSNSSVQSFSNTTTTSNQICPETHLAKAILATLFCCLPFGIIAIVNAASVESAFRSGDYAGAQLKSTNADKWGKYAIISGVVVYVLYIIVVVILGLAGNDLI